MKSSKSTIVRPRVFTMAVLALAAWLLAPGPLPAGNACGLLKAADVAPLLGGAPANKTTPEGLTCTWTGSTAKHKLLVLTYKDIGVPGGIMFMGARKGAAADENAKVNDETGIGDQAFSVQESFGVVFIVLKQGRMLQLQYWTGGQGTNQDVTALRPVVKKAAAAF